MKERLTQIGQQIEDAVMNNRFQKAHEMRQQLAHAVELGIITNQQAIDASFPPYMQLEEKGYAKPVVDNT